MEIEYTGIRDELSFGRDGTATTQKRVEFYIGKHGPFVERFPQSASALDIETRIRQLHSTLLLLPKEL